MRRLFKISLEASQGVMLLIGLSLFPCALPAQTEQPAGAEVLFILDASGSMQARLGNQDKMTIAKEVMTNLIRELPDTVAMGLVAYGHRDKGDCNDIETLAPVGKGDKSTLTKQVQSLQPKGKTPIAKSLELAGEQLKGREDPTTLVLVSDGEETCGGDPCAVAKTLLQQGLKVTLHVVGFDVTDQEKQQLSCIAEAGGGKYFTARTADQLKEALAAVKREVVEKVEAQPQPAPVPERKVIKIQKPGVIGIPNLAHGEAVYVYDQQTERSMGSIRKNDPLKLPPGTYKLKFGSASWEGIEVAAGETIEFPLQVGSISIPNLESGETVFVYDQQTNQSMGAVRRNDPLKLPPGTYKLKLGVASWEGIKVAVDETTEFPLRVGSISVPNLESGETVFVYDQQTDQSMGAIRKNDPLKLPPGTYRLKFGNQVVENIAVEAGQEVVIEQ